MSTTFSPPWWLRNPHAQTVWGRLVRRHQLVSFRREVLTTPDDDDLVLDHLEGDPAPVHFLLMHGLEGSSYSVYMQGILDIIQRRGFSATAMNFRSCARYPNRITLELPNRRPRFYHSGETTDFDFLTGTLAKRLPGSTLVAFGASLGGNVLLKWLGEHPHQGLIAAAATLSVPYDLAAGSAELEKTAIGRMYVLRFLASLKRKTAYVTREFPAVHSFLDLEQALNGKTFQEFDDAATAPLHGFADAEDYYTRSSSIHYLGRITTPTLCLNAEDDPFLPKEVLPRARAVASAAVDFRTSDCGGHVGFIAGDVPWRCTYWAEELVVEWLIARATEARQQTGTAAAT